MTRPVDELRALGDALDAGGDQGFDFPCRLGAAPGQAAHLTGHHGKPAALFAGPGRLHGGVEGQDIGLESNTVDHADDVCDLARCLIDAPHGVHHLCHHLAALHGCAAGFLCQHAGLACRVGMLVHDRAQLLHGGCRLLQCAGLQFGSVAQILVTLGNFGRGHRHLV